MSLLFLIGLSFVFAISQIAAEDSRVVSYSEYQVWKIKPSSEEDRQFVSNIIDSYELQLWHGGKITTDPMDVLVPPQTQTKLKLKLAEGQIAYNIIIDDLEMAIKDQKLSMRSDTSNMRAAYNMDWTSYHRLGDIYAYLTYLNTTYPKLVQLINIGSSYENRPLYVIRISNSSSPGTRPAIWIDGGFHAREWISPAVATYIIQQLVEVPENSTSLHIVDWYIMPVVNPDGYEYTFTNDRLWRKTRSVAQTSRCRGVDPNRNFGYKWGGLGTSADPCSNIYKGTRAFSEPETLATSNFIFGKSSQIKLYLTLHSYGKSALIPWGYDVVFPTDYDALLALANKATAKFVKYLYTVGNSAALFYPAAGGSDDWAKSIGIAYAYTFELPDTSNYGFLLPPSEILPVCRDFFPALDVFAGQIATENATTTAKPLTTTSINPQSTTATAKPTKPKCSCGFCP